jgi:uncharacterized protein (TIGR02466 family)
MDHAFEWSFGTPIYSAIVDDYKGIQKEIKKTVDNTTWNTTSDLHWGITQYLSDPTFSGNIIGNKFENELSKHITQYVQNFYMDPYNWRIKSSWLTMNKKGSYGIIHEHGSSTISGVYYYQTNEKDGEIFFRTPNHFFKQSYIWKNLKCERTVQPKEGLLILFPGWLDHGVKMNETDHDRISLSFNVILK